MVLIRFVVTRIGNTAEYTTSGLDERQAAGLLSAVGEAGLSLVEPGPASDPAGAGLGPMDALDRARRAWERTSPQLVIDGWLDMLDGLDEQRAGAALLVEPSSGFVVGDGTTAALPLAAAPSPLTFDGHGANHIQVARRARKGA